MNDRIVNVTSHNQTGGITAHTVTGSQNAATDPPVEKTNSETFWKRFAAVAALVGGLGAIVGALAKFIG